MQTAGTLWVPCGYPAGSAYISPGPNWENPAIDGSASKFAVGKHIGYHIDAIQHDLSVGTFLASLLHMKMQLLHGWLVEIVCRAANAILPMNGAAIYFQYRLVQWRSISISVPLL